MRRFLTVTARTVPARTVPARTASALSTIALLAALALLPGCSSGSPSPEVTVSPSSSVPPAGPTSPRGKLAARAAAAKDLRQVAFYTLKTSGRPDRQVSFVRATDGSWRVDIQGGAHGGAVDIALVRTGNKLYQCVINGGERRGCVVVDKLTVREDPKLQHLISDWLDVLTDRDLPLAVSIATALPGSSGECYAVDSSATTVGIPIDVGVYCYAPDGTLTGARFGVGTLALAGRPGAAPPQVDLPGPVVPGKPLRLAAPPSPTPTPSESPAPSPSRRP